MAKKTTKKAKAKDAPEVIAEIPQAETGLREELEAEVAELGLMLGDTRKPMPERIAIEGQYNTAMRALKAL